ncbi:MAG: glycosyltransferase family 4 protein [Gemmatales bacterium]
MKIALCYESMMPNKGGCETYLADLARYLVEDGHGVHLFASRLDAESFPAQVMHHLLPASTGLRFLRPWQFAKACHAALQQHDFDVTIGFIKTWGQDVLMPQGGFHAASAEHNINKHHSWLMRTLVRLIHTIDPKQWSFRALERKQLFGFPSILVVPSRMVQQHGKKHYGLSDDRMRVVHNAIDHERFPTHDRLLVRAKMRDAHQLHPEDPVGLFVGHNYRLKGLIPLLESLRLLPREVNFRLLICGSPNYARFQRMAERLGVAERVRFLGFHPDVREAFFASDFLVHPSFYDPCALVTMEALACGLPVITTRLNGGSELLPGALSTLTIDTPHDHAAMAKQITRLCQPVERSTLSRAARDASQQWTFSDHYRALCKVLEEVAARKRPRHSTMKPGMVS